MYAVGTNGLIAYFDGTEWMEEVPITNEDLLSVYVNENHDGWAVGKNGTILRCTGGVWSVYNSPASQHLNKVSFYRDDLGFIVGNEGAFLSTKAKLPVGIFSNPLSTKSLHMYPNPAGDYFFVEIPQPTSSLQVSITDMMGRVVYEENVQTKGIVDPLRISSERFSPGIYLIKIVNERELLTGKIIKN